jgi:hypothetical protein
LGTATASLPDVVRIGDGDVEGDGDADADGLADGDVVVSTTSGDVVVTTGGDVDAVLAELPEVHPATATTVSSPASRTLWERIFRGLHPNRRC